MARSGRRLCGRRVRRRARAAGSSPISSSAPRRSRGAGGCAEPSTQRRRPPSSARRPRATAVDVQRRLHLFVRRHRPPRAPRPRPPPPPRRRFEPPRPRRRRRTGCHSSFVPFAERAPRPGARSARLRLRPAAWARDGRAEVICHSRRLRLLSRRRRVSCRRQHRRRAPASPAAVRRRLARRRRPLGASTGVAPGVANSIFAEAAACGHVRASLGRSSTRRRSPQIFLRGCGADHGRRSFSRWRGKPSSSTTVVNSGAVGLLLDARRDPGASS